MNNLAGFSRAVVRMQITRDVLDSLPIMNVSRGSFISGIHSSGSEILKKSSYETSKADANDLKSKCYVCALGACFLSAVSLKNNFDFKENSTGGFLQIKIDSIFLKLEEFFDREQLSLIETAFEQGSGYFANNNDYRNDAASEFGFQYPHAEDRLKAIMENILVNYGTFVPEKETYD